MKSPTIRQWRKRSNLRASLRRIAQGDDLYMDVATLNETRNKNARRYNSDDEQ